jgi:putative DNA primase/helicase
MTPPNDLPPGRWLRFPGCGKNRGNRAGWCRVISPTLAIFGDWSTGLTETWKDSNHRDDADTRRLLAEARERERAFAAQARRKQAEVARQAADLIMASTVATHPYMARKGFPAYRGLVHRDKLVVPMRDARDYGHVLSAQLIDAGGDKKFLPGGRASGAVYRLGSPMAEAKHIVLCEGYATGLSIHAALARLPGPNAVLVCFSARNLETVAPWFPNAVVAADNDVSATGEQSALRTGLRWTMPYEVGTDFNDLMVNMGLHCVTERMRELLWPP